MVLQSMTHARFDPQETLAELVMRHPACARVFQRHNLEFCCDGDQPLAQACRRRLLPIEQVLTELRGAASLPSTEVDLRQLPLAELLGYLEDQHTALAKGFPKLAEGARALADLAPRRPWLKELAWDLTDLSDVLLPHLYAERGLLGRAREANGSLRRPGSLERRGLEEDHAELGEIVADLHLSLDPFRGEPEASPDGGRVFAELDALEAQLMRTVHLETHLLPRRLRELQAPGRPMKDKAFAPGDDATAWSNRQAQGMKRTSPQRPQIREASPPQGPERFLIHSQWDIAPGETLLADGRRDTVLEASLESFPASDPPGRY